jgi:nitroreductase
MEMWDVIWARRNVRPYTDRAIAREDLQRILDAGRRAPSPRETGTLPLSFRLAGWWTSHRWLLASQLRRW